MAEARNEFSVVGKKTPRIDAYERVTGQAQYTGDIQVPGMLYARVLRSPHAHAAIAATDRHLAEDALALIKVEYEKLPYVLDANEALKSDAPKITPDGNLSV